MSGRAGDDPLLDRLARLARDEEPPPLGPRQEDQLLRRAMAGAFVDGRSRRQVSVAWVFAAAAAAALLVAGGALVGLHRSGHDQAPFRAVLTTGDRITATPGAELRVESMAPEDRRVAVESGAALFDVVPLGEGERFRVVTAHLEVEVRGTVFSVEADRERTVVRVYEGQVEVVQGDRRRPVAARRTWASDGSPCGTLEQGPLAVAGFEAARRREAVASRETTPSEGSREAPPAAGEGGHAETGLAAVAADDVAPAPPVETETAGEPVVLATAPTTTAPDHPSEAGPAPAGGAPVRPPRPAPPTAPTVEGGETEERPPSAREARLWIASSRGAEALEAARAALARGEAEGDWRMVEADALRALGRPAEAAESYLRASRVLSRAGAAQAGYLAASVRFRSLGDPAGALAALEATDAEGPGSPLAERALALRARALDGLGRGDEARAAARRYLDRYPEGGMASWMRALLGESAPEGR